MTTHLADTSMSNLSVSGAEDWDASSPSMSVPFPAGAQEDQRGTDSTNSTSRSADGSGRTLSQLLRLHAEKGTEVNFSQEEADAVAEALNVWVCFHSVFPTTLQITNTFSR